MGIKEQISNFLEKRREAKERENQMVADSKLEQKIEFKKLTPEERQLAKHYKMQKMKSDRAKLKRIWAKNERKATIESNPSNIPFVFKDNKKLMSGESVFKPHKTNNDICFKNHSVKEKNIFVMNKGVGLR